MGPFAAGNALYAAAGAGLAGALPLLVARAGSDYPVDQIAAAGLSTDAIRRVSGPAFHVLIREDDGVRRLAYRSGSGNHASLDPAPDDLPETPLDGIHIGPAMPQAQAALLSAARERGLSCSFDSLFVSNVLTPRLDALLALMPLADVFLPSLADASRLLPGRSPSEIVRIFREAGCASVVLKMGAEGSLGSDGSGLFHVPAIDTRVVDATGAGDAFCGGFQADWAGTGNLLEAMAWGAAVASIAIEDFGAHHMFTDDKRQTARSRQGDALKRMRQIR